MKNAVLITSLVIMSPGLSFAQIPAAVSGATRTAPSAATISGKIQSVSDADPAKGTRAQISVAAGGSVKTFVIKAGTTIYDVSGRPLTVKDLKKDEDVKLSYKNAADGSPEALSVYKTK